VPDTDPVRVAALADIHAREGNEREIRDLFGQIGTEADVLVLAGDLTGRGQAAEAEILADIIRSQRLPVVGVLGNHDYESDQVDQVKTVLCDAGMHLLDDEPHEIHGVGFAGVKGFYGGFGSHVLAPFGEPLVKRFVHETIDEGLRLESGLHRLRSAHRVAVLHYAPIRETVVGEPEEIFPFLGSSRLEEPIDRFEATVAVHGHAHHGAPEGRTAHGVPVYNVAYPLLQTLTPERPYRILTLSAPDVAIKPESEQSRRTA